MNVDDIRDAFVRFMTERGHVRVPSASLVPHGDPTLLFTSAGMVPFKPYFMGLAEPPAPRIVTVQKVFRTTDIDEVGDYSHLTMFEMLGNFSFGDYFKEQAIPWAWELLTTVFKLDAEKLWVSIYEDDNDAHKIWRDVGIPDNRIHRYDQEHNYWPPGNWDGIGPCGPNSEIFVDRGPRESCEFCRDGACKPNLEPDCDRFLEVWNLVFMTLYQDEHGNRTELPRKNIDTGSGLERVACILQNKDTVYDTDVFRPIIKRVEEIAIQSYDIGNDERDRAMRIVAEHTRASVFLIADGVMPSNEGRGYVLRKLIRRATHYGRSLVGNKTFLERVGRSVIERMNRSYPALLESAPVILNTLKVEELKFTKTLFKGQRLIAEIAEYGEFITRTLRLAVEDERARVNWAASERPLAEMFQSSLFNQKVAESVLESIAQALPPRPWLASREELERARDLGIAISGRTLRIFWSTYGFPPDLTAEVARTHRLRVEDGAAADFEKEMEVERERSRAAAKFEFEAARVAAYTQLAGTRTSFVGYDATEHTSTIAGIITAIGVQDSAIEGDDVEVALIETPFYPEGGGQVGDAGEIVAPQAPNTVGGVVAVDDTQYASEGLIVHRGRVVSGRIALNDAVTARVDPATRRASQRNHTATHLLHAALREVLGTHVKQAGSLVAPDRLRFDFTHIEATKPDELAAVQRLVNQKIRADIDVHAKVEPYELAIEGGAMALFGEKYTADVRVVGICEPQLPLSTPMERGPGGEVADLPLSTPMERGPGDEVAAHCFSKELCGGTHCGRTGEIGTFIIASEASVGSGVRRIEALTGALADDYVIEQQSALARAAHRLSTTPAELDARIDAREAELTAALRKAEQFQRAAGKAEVDQLIDLAERIDGASLVVARVPAASTDAMREMGDLLRDKLGSAVIVLGAVMDDRPSFMAMSTKNITSRVHAGNLIKQVAAVAGGGGGGRPEMALAGGKDASKLDEALETARRIVRESLAAS